MEIPYSTLLRIAWALWWRFYAVMALLAVAIVTPFIGLRLFYPAVWEMLEATQIDRDFLLLGVLPGMEVLAGWPVAIRGFLRSRAKSLNVAVRYSGNAAPVLESKNRQLYLFTWSLCAIPVLWELANALLMHALFPGASGGWQVWGATAAIYGNVALLQLLAFLPMSINWAMGASPVGVEWRLTDGQDTAGT